MNCRILAVAAFALITLAPAGRSQVVESIELTAGPEAIASFAAAPHEGWLYVFGGHTGRPHHHSRENLSRRFWRIKADAPSTIEDLPGGDGLQGVTMVSTGGHLYRIGGLRALNHPEDDARLRSEVSVMRYDPARRSWDASTDLPSPRSSHDAIAMDGAIYVFGGWDLSDGEESWYDHGYRGTFIDGKLTWSRIEQPFTRRANGVAAHEGRIWAIGGLSKNGRPSRRVDVYSPATGSWERGPDLPSMGFGATAFGTPQGLFVALLSGAVLRLADDGQTWTTIGQLTFPRFFSRLLPAGVDRFACIAGAGRIGHMSTIEWLKLGRGDRSAPAAKAMDESTVGARNASAQERIGHFAVDDSGPASFVRLDLENPLPSKNRQLMFTNAGKLYLFGGNNSLGQHDLGPANLCREGISIDLATLATENLASLPHGLQSAATAMTGSEDMARGFVLGGFGADDQEGTMRSRSEIFGYNPIGREWKRCGTLPVPLTQCRVTEHGESLWIFGGLDYDPSRSKSERFHLSDRIYRAPISIYEDLRFTETEFHLPVPRRGFGAAKLDGHYYIVGGMHENFAVADSFLAFDFADGSWKELPTPSARIAPNLVALGKKLYLIGGSEMKDGDAVPSQKIEVFDTVTSTWSVHPDALPLSARHLRVTTMAGRILLMSTHNESNELDLVVFKP